MPLIMRLARLVIKRPSAKGALITFEGTEGAGKTSLMNALENEMRASGFAVVRTREPGGTPLGEWLREGLLERPMNPWTELFLYEAARAEHVACVIKPALEQGSIVLCDRFTDSSLAYQSGARGLPWREVERLNRLATFGIEPDLVVFVDVDPGLGLKRATKTRFEAEGLLFQKRVRAAFLKARRENPNRWLRIASSKGTPEMLARSVMITINRRFAGLTT